MAFDVYGTLIDTQGVTKTLQRHVGELAPEFARIWREKQLEYSFRRGLMRSYQPFSVCIAQSLDYTTSLLGLSLPSSTRDELLQAYRTLPAFMDARAGLQQAADAGMRCFAFSNGAGDAVEGLLQQAGIREAFEGVVSVNDLQTFKPNPDVYDYFLRSSKGEADSSWLISGNPFDVIGAREAGMKAAWVKRSPAAVFDPWGIEPTVVIESLAGLVAAVKSHS
nr:haloacid dehalogenase type II [Pseudomaricurvus sp. HS19]